MKPCRCVEISAHRGDEMQLIHFKVGHPWKFMSSNPNYTFIPKKFDCQLYLIVLWMAKPDGNA